VVDAWARSSRGESTIEICTAAVTTADIVDSQIGAKFRRVHDQGDPPVRGLRSRRRAWHNFAELEYVKAFEGEWSCRPADHLQGICSRG
jgi:hypothetical protein